MQFTPYPDQQDTCVYEVTKGVPHAASPPVNHPLHPLATRARVLLSSVFGPYSRDDEYGSRKINPMELYQNQVTRLQGGFSLRMFHRSFGLMMNSGK